MIATFARTMTGTSTHECRAPVHTGFHPLSEDRSRAVDPVVDGEILPVDVFRSQSPIS
jgi:hypothetical protein